MSADERWRVPAGHAVFAGHFPGLPVVPAAMLLADALAAIARATGTTEAAWEVSEAKFLAAVAPDVELTLRHARTEAGVRFEILAADRPVASGRLRLAAR